MRGRTGWPEGLNGGLFSCGNSPQLPAEWGTEPCHLAGGWLLLATALGLGEGLATPTAEQSELRPWLPEEARRPP